MLSNETQEGRFARLEAFAVRARWTRSSIGLPIGGEVLVDAPPCEDEAMDSERSARQRCSRRSYRRWRRRGASSGGLVRCFLERRSWSTPNVSASLSTRNRQAARLLRGLGYLEAAGSPAEDIKHQTNPKTSQSASNKHIHKQTMKTQRSQKNSNHHQNS